MRLLGIDYGRARIGLALSDPDGRMAFPYGVVGGLREVRQIAEKEGVEGIVLGLPRSLSRAETEESRRVRRFARELARAVKLPVAFADETMTSKIAERTAPRELADASAAALILQSYLDRERHEPRV